MSDSQTHYVVVLKQDCPTCTMIEPVIAEIEDTGTGIPENSITKVFEPFFTMKPTGEGTGLGLSVSQKIIDLHKGRIKIMNRKEGGVRVVLAFKADGGGPR